MHRLAVLPVSATLVLLAACSSSSGGAPPPSDAAAPTDSAAVDAGPSYPRCAGGTAQLTGTIDGAPVDLTLQEGNGGFSNNNGEGTSNYLLTGSGSISIHWTFDDAGSGQITFPSASGGPLAGKTLCLGGDSSSSASPQYSTTGMTTGVGFAMGGLSTSTDGTCPGTPVSGSVTGCVAFGR